jgi:hypothetical protein
MNLTPVRLPALILFSLALLMPAKSAANSCPWLTKGSAEAALGGSVTAIVQISDSGEGSCTFTRELATSKDAPKDMLKIVVQKASQAPCPEGSLKLKGIGNEAMMCTEQRSPQESIDRIVSHVRDLNFTVTMTAHKRPPNNPEVSPADSAVEQIAEQVAGNLF